jgi:transcriptional regulator with GAF, ATPase, and Fis domain
MSLDETLNQVLECVFQIVQADRGYVMLLESPEGKKNAPPELVCKAQKLRGPGPASDEVSLSRSITEQVLQHGKSLLTSDAQQDPRFQSNQSIMLTGIRSIMAVPLMIEERVLGMIYVDSPVHTNRFTKRNLELLTLIASVAAIRIENVRLLDAQQEQKRLANELALASEIQLRLHPSASPSIEGYDLMGVSFPCYEVGGDYFDFIEKRDGRHVIALGDVSGKGTGAALLMSSIHAAVRAQATTRPLAQRDRQRDQPVHLRQHARQPLRDALLQRTRSAHASTDLHQRRPQFAVARTRLRRSDRLRHRRLSRSVSRPSAIITKAWCNSNLAMCW